jgi:hypothetical protein
MDIYSLLPIELQNKVKYLVLEHPVAKIIKDEIRRLRCDEYHTFRDEQGHVFCKIDGRDFLASEYFRQLNKKKDDHTKGVMGYADTDSDDECLDEVFERMFFVSSSSDED